MDDYPRAPIMTDMEAHLDLHMWMVVSTRTVSRIADILGKSDDVIHYSDLAADFLVVLKEHFWDEDRQIYDEFYIDEDGNKKFDGHTGYLNFFPLFLEGIDPSDDRFEVMMNKLVSNTTGMWSDYGIRSLSKFDPYYRLGDDYWTSPIWMNINFLITSALHSYSTSTEVS